MFDKCSGRTYCLYSTILIIFALSWLLWSAYSLVRYLKCQVLWTLMKAQSGEHLECFRGMVFQMLGALLSSKIVSRGSYLWPPSIKIIGRRNLVAMTRMGLPDVSSLILIHLSVLLWDPRTWEHRSHACVHVASSTLIETPTSGSWGRYMFNFMNAFNWSSKARAPVCIVSDSDFYIFFWTFGIFSLQNFNPTRVHVVVSFSGFSFPCLAD